jgi:hypothetical protein
MPDLIVGGVIVALSFAACVGYTGWLLYGVLTDNPAVVCDDPAETAAAENPLAAGDEFRAHLANIDTQVAAFRTDIEAFERGRWVR